MNKNNRFIHFKPQKEEEENILNLNLSYDL